MSYIGQEVVCIKGRNERGYKLIEGQTYTIHQISGCKCQLAFDVGIKIPGSTTCRKCNTMMGSFGEWFHHASRFITLEEYEAHNEAVEEMVKNIPKIHEHQ